jgi:cytochrome c oxidase cbb3-type subunit 3
MSTPMTRSIGTWLGMSVFCAALGCTHRAADLAEWTPADHHHQAEGGGAKAKSRHLGQTGTYTQPSSNRNLLVEVTWMKQCASCHGKRGRGDGPNAAMFKPRDLVKLDWQDSVKDEEIAKVIKDGRNKMPAFNLPDSTINDLVGHVRSFAVGERDRVARAAAAGTGPESEEEAENGEAAKGKEEAAPAAKAAPDSAKKEPAATAEQPAAGK